MSRPANVDAFCCALFAALFVALIGLCLLTGCAHCAGKWPPIIDGPDDANDVDCRVPVSIPPPPPDPSPIPNRKPTPYPQPTPHPVYVPLKVFGDAEAQP